MRIMHIADFGRDEPELCALFARICTTFHDPVWRDEVSQQILIRRNAMPVFDLETLGLNLESLPFRRWLDFSTPTRVADRLQVYRPDIVLVWRAEAMGALRLETHRCLIGIASDYGPVSRWRACRRLIALNEDLGEAVQEQGWSDDHIDLPSMPVSNEIVQPFPRKGLHTPFEADLVVSTPLTTGDTGGYGLIRVLAGMKDIFLWMIAPRRDHKKLMAFADRMETTSRLRLLEPRLDHRAYYAAADVVVAASTKDTIGYSVIEAWSQSRPIVGAGAIGPACLIRHGDSGMLSSSGDDKALQRTLRRILQDPILYDRLAAGGRRVYETHHQESLATDGWLACFYRALGQAVPVSPNARTVDDQGRHADITA